MDFNIVLMIILLVALVLAALATVLTRTLPMATVMLALTSVLLTVFLFISGMHLAAVIELSVSAGLVTAIFASAIAMLKPTETADGADGDATGDDATADSGKKKSSRLMRYLPLPVILLVLAAAVLYFVGGVDLNMAKDVSPDSSPQMVLWGERALDVIGLILLILAGVLGIAALIRRREEK
jgi:NADH:ubiquinone oxidoreductase subunit 6 (subunit J)